MRKSADDEPKKPPEGEPARPLAPWVLQGLAEAEIAGVDVSDCFDPTVARAQHVAETHGEAQDKWTRDGDDIAESMVPPMPGRRSKPHRELYQSKSRKLKLKGGRKVQRLPIAPGGPASRQSLPKPEGPFCEVECRSIRPDGIVRTSYSETRWSEPGYPVIQHIKIANGRSDVERWNVVRPSEPQQVRPVLLERKRGRKPLHPEHGKMDERTKKARQRAIKAGKPFILEDYLKQEKPE
jgi:hypothetical protein